VASFWCSPAFSARDETDIVLLGLPDVARMKHALAEPRAVTRA
jgi:hypothetical protein